VEPEGGVIDVALLGLEVSGKSSESAIHLESSLLPPKSQKNSSSLLQEDAFKRKKNGESNRQ